MLIEVFIYLFLMERVSLNYSRKNIPLPSREEYEFQFIEKSESLFTRMKWFAWHALNPGRESDINSYGFNTTKAAPSIPELKEFELDVLGILKRIKFRGGGSRFQEKLKRDIKGLTSSNKVIVSADKTSNLYRVGTDEYRKSVSDEITSSYKKVGRGQLDGTNRDAAKLVSGLELADRVDQFAESEPFVLIKDHKDGYPSRVKNRLVNPAKSSVGRIGKQLLDEINRAVRVATELPQWSNTAQVIKWFEGVVNKRQMSFVKYHD